MCVYTKYLETVSIVIMHHIFNIQSGLRLYLIIKEI